MQRIVIFVGFLLVTVVTTVTKIYIGVFSTVVTVVGAVVFSAVVGGAVVGGVVVVV